MVCFMLTNPDPPRQQNNLFSINSKYKTITQKLDLEGQDPQPNVHMGVILGSTLINKASLN